MSRSGICPRSEGGKAKWENAVLGSVEESEEEEDEQEEEEDFGYDSFRM